MDFQYRGLVKLKGISAEVEVFQILPQSLASRTFPPNFVRDAEVRMNNEVAEQMEKLNTETEQLKKQVGLLESRINQLDVEASRFAEKLAELREKQYSEVSVESFTAMWDELNEIMRKQEETQHIATRIDESNSSTIKKLNELSVKWNQVFGEEVNSEDDPKVKIMKQKCENLKK